MEIPYLEYFGLTEKPFGMSPDPQFYFESREHKRAFEYLTFFVSQQEGFALISGDVGSGKTTISRIFLDSLDSAKYNSALILNPVTDEAAFIKEVLKEFGIRSGDETKEILYDRLRRFLLEEFQRGKENILIIDEAQLLSYEMLEFIRLLSNIETDKQKILHTIFFAQQEFLEKLKDKRLRHLAQRITVNCSIKPLSFNETKSYINYRLFKAGSRGPLAFRDRAIRLIHIASKGYPRLINYICDRCLLVLYAKSAHTVDSHVVSKVVLEENIPLSSVRNTGYKVQFINAAKITGIAAFTLIGLMVCYLLFSALYSQFWTRNQSPFFSFSPSQRHLMAPSASRAGQAFSQKEAITMATTAIPLKTVIVNREAANVRSDADRKSPRIGTIMKGETLSVLGEKSDGNNLIWYKIKLLENREGWIASTVVVQKDGLN